MKKLPVEEGIIIAPNNPFKDDIEKMLMRSKQSSKSVEFQGVRTEEYQFTIKKTYLPIGFSRLTQDKELFSDLSPNACKILVYIAVYMGYEDQRIQLLSDRVGIERRAFSKAILELILKRVLIKEKKTYYWVNITIIVVGRINHSQIQNNKQA